MLFPNLKLMIMKILETAVHVYDPWHQHSKTVIFWHVKERVLVHSTCEQERE